MGNAWVFAQIDGAWYATTWEWLRPGQTSKTTNPLQGGKGYIQHEPVRSWRPQSGELIGLMVSTPARTAERTINERSNVSLVVWP